MDNNTFNFDDIERDNETMLLDQTFTAGNADTADDQTVLMPKAAPQDSAPDHSHDVLSDADVLRLGKERDRLRSINALLETTIQHFKGTKSQMDRFEANIDTTHSLMDLYVKILSQAEHNSELLLDGEWELDKDLQALADQQRQQEAAESERAREERDRLARDMAETEKLKVANTANTSRAPTSSRGRGTRIASSGVSSSGIGRSASSARGNPRGSSNRGIK